MNAIQYIPRILSKHQIKFDDLIIFNKVNSNLPNALIKSTKAWMKILELRIYIRVNYRRYWLGLLSTIGCLTYVATECAACKLIYQICPGLAGSSDQFGRSFW